MAQTLITLPAATAPIAPTQSNTLSGDISAIQNLDNRQVVALSVISKIRSLKAYGGTDYTANHKQLRIDATSFMGGFSFIGYEIGPFSRMQAVIDWNQALFKDGTTPTSVNTLVAEMAGFRENPESTLMMFYMFLKYVLSRVGG